MSNDLPEFFFTRQDDDPDEVFYAAPRFVTHIDDETIAEITRYYEERFPPGSRLLDLMSSWISHLPDDVTYEFVAGLGMNRQELAANPRLDERVVQNLNENPVLPFPDEDFHGVLIAVSIQYLTHPFMIFPEVARVLKPGGCCIVAMSHRLFPTKAVYAFQALGPADRIKLVMKYMEAAGLTDIVFIDRSPDKADPLWIVQGIKGGEK